MSSIDATEMEAQQTLVKLLRQERNEAISSLAAAKAELELAREDLDHIMTQRRKSPSPTRTIGSFSSSAVPSSTAVMEGSSGGHAYRQHISGYEAMREQQQQQQQSLTTTTVDDTVRVLLQAARLRNARTPANNNSGASASATSTTTFDRQQQLPPSPTRSSTIRGQLASEERRLDDELASHLELTHRQIGELERRIERYETEVQTAMTRNEELQLRLDASLMRERTLAERNTMLDEELTVTRQTSLERESALEMLKMETAKLMAKVNALMEREAHMESQFQALTVDHRQAQDEIARLRGTNDALQLKNDELDTDLEGLKVSSDRREEDYRLKLVVLSRELASAREQRDQALRPYHARQATSATVAQHNSPMMTSTNVLPLSPPPAATATTTPQRVVSGLYTTLSSSSPSAYTVRSSDRVGGGSSGGYSSSSYAYGGGTSSGNNTTSTTAEVLELKRQVQWLLERVPPGVLGISSPPSSASSSQHVSFK